MTLERLAFSLTQVDEQKMKHTAQAFADELQPGDVVSLEGELGAGKTYFVREVARCLGYAQKVTSPSFVLQKIYELPTAHRSIACLVHYDVYRLDTYEELQEIGFEESRDAAVTFVEWGDKFIAQMPTTTWRMQIFNAGNLPRRLVISGPRQRATRLMLQLGTRNLTPEPCSMGLLKW